MDIYLGSQTLHLERAKPGRGFSSGMAKPGPGCWKVETVPGVRENPNQANYYRKLFQSKFYQKGAFQYMFGGILRAIFGMFSPYRYWDKELEDQLHDDLKDSYTTTKRVRDYGIYTFQVTRSLRVLGVIWKQGVRPAHLTSDSVKRGAKGKTPWGIMKGSYVYVRVNKLDFDSPVVDIEFYSRKTKQAEVISISYQEFNRIMKVGKFIRQADFDGGRFYPLYHSKRGKRV